MPLAMAEGTSNDNFKDKTCSICYRTGKLKFPEEIEKNIIMELKPYMCDYFDNTFMKGVEYLSATDTKRSKKTRKRQDKLEEGEEFIKQEIESLKALVCKKLQKLNKIVADFENTLLDCNGRHEEMKNTLEEKLECIKQLEQQNSCLQHGFKQLSQRLEFVEQSLIRAKIELNYIQLGQQLNVDFTTPPRLYNTDFQVRDHKMSGGVWLYNTKDGNGNVDSGLAASTEYFSTESPGKSTALTGFQMAPGGERRKSTTEPAPKDTVDDLQRRLDNLRGFNL